MKKALLLLSLFSYILIVSCSSQRNVIKTASVAVANTNETAVMDIIAGILLDQGYEIKNTTSKIITTEWKMYYSIDKASPPFDFFIQLQFKVSTAGGKIKIQISPMIKEINRLNPAAYTPFELYVFKESEYERDRNSNSISGLSRHATAIAWGQEYFIDFLNQFGSEIGIHPCDFEYKTLLQNEIF